MISHALLIGINRYRVVDGGFKDLQGCLNDVELMKGTLLATGVCAPERVEVLLDEQATFRNVTDALGRWLAHAKRGERLFLYYSGHGTQVPDADADEEGTDEALVLHDFSKTNALVDDIFRSFLARVPEETNATVIFDCCHSGGLSKGDAQPRGGDPIPRSAYTPADMTALKALKALFEVEAQAERFTMLAAAQEDELAWEREVGGRKQGLFTYALCEFLKAHGPEAPARDVIDQAVQIIQRLPPPRFYQVPRMIGKEELFGAPLFA